MQLHSFGFAGLLLSAVSKAALAEGGLQCGGPPLLVRYL
jgi:hypothetical protein